MSVRLRISLVTLGIGLVPGAAMAQGLLFPGPGAQLGDRPSYREAYNHYPPTQHNILGMPTPAPAPYARPTYREANNDYPPPGGRYGGGFFEYMMTGGRPEPVAPQAYAEPYPVAAPAPEPVYGAAPNPLAAVLPHSSLPDYAPQPPAYYGLAPSPAPSAQPMAYNVPTGQTYDPVAADPGIATRPMNPVYYRQAVAYSGRERPGTIVIDTPNKFLYLVQPRGQALRYGIGVGRPGFAWSGVKTISRKAEWPGWTPPPEMLARRPDLPRHMDGGEANPLGARALYLGSSMYRIHGTNEPYTIGTNVSSGCIRMMNQDVIDLYGRVGVGTRVIVM